MKYSKTREKKVEKKRENKIRDTMWIIWRKCTLNKKKKHRFAESSVGSERVRDMDCDLCAQRTEIISICRNCTMSMVNEGAETATATQQQQWQRCWRREKSTRQNCRSKNNKTAKLTIHSMPQYKAIRKTATMTTKCQPSNETATCNNKNSRIAHASSISLSLSLSDQCVYILHLRSHNINIVLHIWYRAKPCRTHTKTDLKRKKWTSNGPTERSGRLLFDTF